MIGRIIRPGVQIQQIFLAVNPTLVTPDLPTVIVGPNYQIVPATNAGTYTGVQLAAAYPSLELGAVVVQVETAVSLTAIRTQVYGTADPVTVADDVLTLAPTGGNPNWAAVAAGDLLVVTIGGTAYNAVVLAKNSNTSLKIDRDLPASAAATVIITRTQADVNLTAQQFATSAAAVTLNAALTVAALPVVSATVKIAFRALRQITANALTVIGTADDITAKLGVLDSKNPLAVGALAAKSNTVSSILVMGVSEETSAAYLSALGQLQTQNVYSIVLLTQDAAIQSLLKTHVTQMSLPEKSKFRIGWINLPHPRESVVAQTLTAAQLSRTAGQVQITQPTGAFAGVVRVGDMVLLTARVGGANPSVDVAKAAAYAVTQVKNNSTLLLDDRPYAGAEGAYVAGDMFQADFAADYFDMEVIRVLDRDGEANAIAETANSYASRRIVYITNASVVITLGSTDTTLPGYYLAAAYAGMCAGNPPHQGFTNLGVSGIKSVLFGKGYFNDDQESLIAGSGGWIVDQDTATSLPYAFLQTTTDNSTVQTRELSITKTLDFYSFALKAVVGRFIGPWNNIPPTLTAISNGVNGLHKQLLGQVYPQIGSPILSGSIVTLKQDDLQPDQAVLVTRIEIPTPLNRIMATVEVGSSAA